MPVVNNKPGPAGSPPACSAAAPAPLQHPRSLPTADRRTEVRDWPVRCPALACAAAITRGGERGGWRKEESRSLVEQRCTNLALEVSEVSFQGEGGMDLAAKLVKL